MAKRSPPASRSRAITSNWATRCGGPEIGPLRSGTRGTMTITRNSGARWRASPNNRATSRDQQVLVFDVDQASRSSEGMPIRANDAPLAPPRERIRRTLHRIRPEHLDRWVPGWLRVGGLLGQVVPPIRLLREPGDQCPPRRPSVGERRRVVPSFSEREIEIADRWTFDGDLDVMPGRSRSVLFVERLHLWIAEMPGVVSPSVTEVDPSDESDISLHLLGMAEQHELLVM